MLVRWYVVGAFNPFFRAHAHIDTKRREPYLLDDPYKSIVRDILRLRYKLLPIWYTAFREASVTGIPVLRCVAVCVDDCDPAEQPLFVTFRPHYVVFPQDTDGFAIDDQYFIGASGLLVKPVTEPGVSETSVYLAESQVSICAASYTAKVHSYAYRSTMTISLTSCITARQRVNALLSLQHCIKYPSSYGEVPSLQRASDRADPRH